MVIDHPEKTDRVPLHSCLLKEIQRAERYQHFLSVIVLSITSDDSDSFNDKLGFIIKENIRKVDIVYPYHHKDGFIIILPETSREGALSVAWRIKRELKHYSFARDTEGRNKIHYGIACYPSEAISGDELLEKSLLSLSENNRSLPENIYKPTVNP